MTCHLRLLLEVEVVVRFAGWEGVESGGGACFLNKINGTIESHNKK